jgi:hypothetical protein
MFASWAAHGITAPRWTKFPRRPTDDPEGVRLRSLLPGLHWVAHCMSLLRLAPPVGPTGEEAVSAILAAEGDLDLAGERLYGPCETPGANKARLQRLIGEDPDLSKTLHRSLRTIALLQAFSTFKATAVAVENTLDKMDANQRARFMNMLLQSMTVLTDDHTQTINSTSQHTALNLSLTEAVFKELPPDIQQALKVINSGGPPEVIDQWSLGEPPPNAATGVG